MTANWLPEYVKCVRTDEGGILEFGKVYKVRGESYSGQDFLLEGVNLSWMKSRFVEAVEHVVVKPPIGVKPRKLFLYERLAEVSAAVSRYAEARMEPLQEWLDEIYDIQERLKTL